MPQPATHWDTLAFVASCIIFCISIILNSFGLYLLSHLNHELTNQRIFLASLSLTELLYALVTLCNYILDQFANNNSSLRHALLGRLQWYLYYVYLILPVALAMDRLIGVTFPLKYKVVLSKCKAIMVVISIWFSMLTIAIPTTFTNFEAAEARNVHIVALGITATTIGFSILAYAWIGVKVHQRRKLVGRANNQSKVLKVACLIIITYFIFEAIPSTVMTTMTVTHPDEVRDYVRAVYTICRLNTLSDPIIYLYNYPPLKMAVKEKLDFIKAHLGCICVRQESSSFDLQLHILPRSS